MSELLYPPDPAPLLAVKAVRGNSEILPIIDASGLVTGRSTRRACHTHPDLLHPVVHLHIIDPYDNIYLQKRSSTKDLFPGRWDTAVGGHVTYGESLHEALFRESGEELAFFDFNPVFLEDYIWRSPIESEMVNIFATVTDRDIDPDNDEVEEGRWWTRAEIAEAMGKDVFTPQFEQEYKRIEDRLFVLL
jgi:isopentenyldiphosphate isomerase